jgi:outer membrane receptor protein involved in Fe transport
MSKNRSLSSAVRLALASGRTKSSSVRHILGIGALAATAVSYVPLVQAQQPEGPPEELVVTGSRILRQDYQSASPIVSLSAEDFLSTGTVNAEELLNRLPQIAPNFSSGNNNPGTGQSYLDLRGLGPERTLILIDGKRLMPSEEDGKVDINTVPTAMVERVEILSGGASAVYGSDAVAGAVNFILRDDFEGVEVSAQTGESAEGDTGSVQAEVLVGSSLADNRGHVMLWATRNQRDLLSKGDREFSAQAVSTTSYFPTGHVRRASGNSWTLASVQSVFANNYNSTVPEALGTLVGNDDGTLFSQGGANGENIHNFRTVLGQDINGQLVAQNFLPDFYSFNFEPYNNLIIPQERLNYGANFTFDASDNVEIYSRLMYTDYNSDIRLAPSPAPTGENSTLPPGNGLVDFTVPVTNPFVQANAPLLSILNSRIGNNAVLPGAGATEDFIFRYRFVGNGPRIESYDRSVYQWLGGVRGDLSENWRFDGYYARGKYDERLEQSGNVSVRKVESLLDAPDGGTSICQGGFPLLGVQLSAECVDYVSVVAKNTQDIEHNFAEFVVSGDIFELGGGAASLAVGTFWQELTYEKIADEILASGDVSGFNAEQDIFGKTKNTDLFAELYLPFTEGLGVTAGWRASDHNIAGSNNSYKLELDWNIADPLRFRTSYQRAVRAPGVGELFEPRVEDNPEVTDPCNFDSSFRTGPNATQVEALCVQQGILPVDLPSYSQSTDQIDALQGGNPNLHEETADTYTVGFVWQSDSSLQVSVDYYNIEIEDVITFLDPSLVVNQCFNADGTNPSYSNANVQCQKFGRSAGTAEINDLLELTENIGSLRTDGVDLQLDWNTMLGGSQTLGFNFRSTFINEWSEQPAPGQAFIEYTGTIGDNEGEVIPELKATFTTIWGIGNFQTMLGLRYIDAMEHEESALVGSTDPLICECNGVGSTVYADASARWTPTEALTLRLGIDNLTDQDPKLYTPDQDSGTNPSVYDVIGRRWYLSATYRF